jgi:hypothetical protein
MVIDVSAYLAEEVGPYQELLDEAGESGNELEQILLFRDLARDRAVREPRDPWREIAYLESAMWIFEHGEWADLPWGTYYRTARDLAFTYAALPMDMPAALQVCERALEFSERPEAEGAGMLELEWLRRGYEWLRT